VTHEPLEMPVQIRHLGRCRYEDTLAQMQEFTAARGPQTADELWFLEHDPVFTQGQAGKPEHLLAPGSIPVVQSNRGGQVTYHGPGQLVVYVLLDLRRRGYGSRALVTRLEQAMIDTLAGFSIGAAARADAPGVYVPFAGGELRKIGSIGLRISRGCSYHGLALNVDMDLNPFSRINPCGLRGMRMTQIAEFDAAATVGAVARDLQHRLLARLGPAATEPGATVVCQNAAVGRV
jgi:lipoyl(octanoyl) transferase